MGRQIFSRFFASYGMSAVLLLLCLYYAWVTIQPQQPTGVAAASNVARRILRGPQKPAAVLIVAGQSADEHAFASKLNDSLQSGGIGRIELVEGDPGDARRAIRQAVQAGTQFDVVAASGQTAGWLPALLERAGESHAKVFFPESYRWPTFLMAANLLNIANQIVVIAVIAVGMTLVIVSGGIDLSVGSLVALSSAVVGVLVRDAAHGTAAGTIGMILCSLAGIGVCALVGAFSGTMITVFGIPPFIVTLAMMQVAIGLAYRLTKGLSISAMPESYEWLGRGATWLSIPNAVLLMGVVYAVAYVVMGRMRIGRYIYAIGGNPEASRLSGVPVSWVRVIVYTTSGAMAGLGGVIVTSQLRSASPTYGLSYELYVIAAVVVGGASLSGGLGKVLGTLIGALIMAVIQNGMNLTGVESYNQKIVLGLMILGAVLIDTMKRWSWRMPRFLRRSAPQRIT